MVLLVLEPDYGKMDRDLKNHIAAVIRAARKAKSLTQEQVAALVERTPESLSNVERGHALPSIETLVALCDVLEIDAETVLKRPADHQQKNAAEHRLVQEVLSIVRSLDEASLLLAKAQLQALFDFQTRS